MSPPPKKSLVRASERGPEQSFSHPYNPRSEIHGFMRRAAVGETLAHLVLLERSGRARSTAEQPVRWYPAPETARPSS